VYDRLLPHLDLVLCDVKQMNPEKHKAYTGKDPARIHENIRRFCSKEESVEVIVRTPVIPGYTDDRESFRALADFLHRLDRIPAVQVLPYNPLAGAKHPRIGAVFELEDVREEQGVSPDELCAILKDRGIDAKVLR